MKKQMLKPTALFIFVGILILSFSSCDKILEAFNVDAPFKTNFTIDVSENDPLVFFDQKDIDLTDNDEFNDNRDKIDKFTLNSLSYIIVGYDGEPGISGSGAITFLDGNSQIGDAITEDNVDFYGLFMSGESIEMDITDATKNGVQEVLKNKMKITIKIEGTVTDKPVFIDIELTLSIRANIQP